MAPTLSPTPNLAHAQRPFVRPSLRLREDDAQASDAPNLLRGLSEEETARVFAISSRRALAAREMAFRQGDAHDGVFLILSGQMRIFFTGRSGREITLAYWTAGHFVGGPEMFGLGEHMWSGQAERPTELLHVPGAALRRLAEETPRLALALIDALVQKGKCFSGLIQILATRSASERLARLLVLMADAEGRRSPEGVVLARRQTQNELAKLVGTTRQWVSATLERFREDGLVEVAPHRILIRDAERLRRVGE